MLDDGDWEFGLAQSRAFLQADPDSLGGMYWEVLARTGTGDAQLLGATRRLAERVGRKVEEEHRWNFSTTIANAFINSGKYWEALATESMWGDAYLASAWGSLPEPFCLLQVNLAEAEYNLGRWSEAKRRLRPLEKLVLHPIMRMDFSANSHGSRRAMATSRSRETSPSRRPKTRCRASTRRKFTSPKPSRFSASGASRTPRPPFAGVSSSRSADPRIETDSSCWVVSPTGRGICKPQSVTFGRGPLTITGDKGATDYFSGEMSSRHSGERKRRSRPGLSRSSGMNRASRQRSRAPASRNSGMRRIKTRRRPRIGRRADYLP
jgi:hypothetical protein